jgi:hypothetical protein
MLKDIDFSKVTHTAVAIVPEEVDGQEAWNAYFINTGEELLQTVIVNSKGYGELEGKQRKTSNIRWYLGDMPPYSWIKFEEIIPELFHVNNEFWVSFFVDGQIYDKKYVFVQGAISRDNLTTVPLIEKPGVLIR